MEAELFKREDDFYSLKVDGIVIATSNGMLVDHKLSLKNCQAIERGYDLDELFNKVDESIDYQEFDFTSFRLGFQKALEILGDKKFSEEDMKKAIYIAWEGGDLASTHIIESLQQTEWDVEILEKCLDPTCDGVNRKGECITTGKPKLDTDGCIILKRK